MTRLPLRCRASIIQSSALVQASSCLSLGLARTWPWGSLHPEFYFRHFFARVSPWSCGWFFRHCESFLVFFLRHDFRFHSWMDVVLGASSTRSLFCAQHSSGTKPHFIGFNDFNIVSQETFEHFIPGTSVSWITRHPSLPAFMCISSASSPCFFCVRCPWCVWFWFYLFLLLQTVV